MDRKPKVTHVMADGRELEDITGYKVPVSMVGAYEVLANMVKRHGEKELKRIGG